MEQVVGRNWKCCSVWIEDINQKPVSVSSALIQTKVIKISDLINVRVFQDSKGWLKNFKYRHSLHNIKLVAESVSVDYVSAQKFRDKLAKIIEMEGYVVGQVFNTDKIGLF